METSRQPKSLYDASLGEVALKHFFAGFMQGLGGLAVTIITWGLLYVLIVQFMLPQLQGMITQAEGLINSVQKMNQALPSIPSGDASAGGQIVIPENLLQQFQQMQKK